MSAAAENAGGDKAHYKSYKKKYKKLRFKFDQVMKRSDELFKQDQIASAAIRRIQEENTRLLDLLVDLNSSSHVPKSRRFNIGSPSGATPTRFLSPTLLAAMGELDEEIAGLAGDNDVEPMQLEPGPVNGNDAEAGDQDDNSTDDDDDDDEDDETPPIQRHGAKYSDDEDEDMDDDDREAYLEEIRETNHRRGIPGTPPRYIRDKLKADAERERKEAEEQAKKAAAEVAANGVNGSAPLVLKQEPVDEMPEGVQEPAPHTPNNRNLLVLENTYRRGTTPPYLRNTSPFLMSVEEEDAFYANVDENLNGEIPTLPEIVHTSPNASKGEGDPRNPMSVYCWLRKYQPQVFLQETEGERKPGRGRGGGRRRAAVDADSGDEMPSGAKAAGSKRRRGEDGEEAPNRGGRGPRGGRGGRRKPNEGGEPPVKKQRRLVARNS